MMQSIESRTGSDECYDRAEMEGVTRLVDGTAGPGYEYGRLEIFMRGFWSNVCNNDRFTPDAAQVACKALGYDGGAALRFTQPYVRSLSQVRHSSGCTSCHEPPLHNRVHSRRFFCISTTTSPRCYNTPPSHSQLHAKLHAQCHIPHHMIESPLETSRYSWLSGFRHLNGQSYTHNMSRRGSHACESCTHRRHTCNLGSLVVCTDVLSAMQGTHGMKCHTHTHTC